MSRYYYCCVHHHWNAKLLAIVVLVVLSMVHLAIVSYYYVSSLGMFYNDNNGLEEAVSALLQLSITPATTTTNRNHSNNNIEEEDTNHEATLARRGGILEITDIQVIGMDDDDDIGRRLINQLSPRSENIILDDDISKSESIDVRRTGRNNSTTTKNTTVKTHTTTIIKPDAMLQIDDGKTLVVVGGYTDDYNNVVNKIQFFNVTSQRWMTHRTIVFPSSSSPSLLTDDDHSSTTVVAETHQGIAYDPRHEVLYIVGGQVGPGCSSSTSAVTRVWIQSGRWETSLPSLPGGPRYSPNVEFVLQQQQHLENHDADDFDVVGRTTTTTTKDYLHVFGGAGPNRMDGMTDHWRLDVTIPTNPPTTLYENVGGTTTAVVASHDNVTSSSRSSSNGHNNNNDNKFKFSRQRQWEEMEQVPDAGIHGMSFFVPQSTTVFSAPATGISSLSSRRQQYQDNHTHHVMGYIYYTAYCTMDQMVHNAPKNNTSSNNSDRHHLQDQKHNHQQTASSKKTLMSACHQHAVNNGQLLHHVSDLGMTFRYPIFHEVSSSSYDHQRRHGHWERIADMPFPTCHGGSAMITISESITNTATHSSTDATNRIVIVGGGLSTHQTRQGSAPRSLPLIQILDTQTGTWEVYPIHLRSNWNNKEKQEKKERQRRQRRRRRRRIHLFLHMTWYDDQRKVLYSLHPGNSIVLTKFKLVKNTGGLEVEEEGIDEGLRSIIAKNNNTEAKNNISALSSFPPVRDSRPYFDSDIIRPIQITASAVRQNRRTNIEAFRVCVNSKATTWKSQNDGIIKGSTINATVPTNSSIPPSFPLYTVLDTESSDYEVSRRTWNERNINRQYPDVVTYPSDVGDVVTIVNCARRTGYRLCARNGKHSYDGSSVCTTAVVVDVSQLKDWTVYQRTVDDHGVNNDEEINHLKSDDVSRSNSTIIGDRIRKTLSPDGWVDTRHIVQLGAGMTLGQVTDVLFSRGLALPMGSCATVGLTGLTLAGGQGPLSRMYSLTADHLHSIQFVNADGIIMNATKTNHLSDLLWLAVGGGTVGPHFPGIITSLAFTNLVSLHEPTSQSVEHDTTLLHPRSELQQKPPLVWTRAQIRYPASVENAKQVLLAWHDFVLAHQLYERVAGVLRQRHPGQHHVEDDGTFMDLEWLEHGRRLTVEPWIVLEPRRRRRSDRKVTNLRREGSLDNRTAIEDTEGRWERSLFVNIYFFGNETMHSNIFTPHMLPWLKNWTSDDGQVVRMERLDHFSFQCKLSGVRNRSELVSGRHGHDVGHFRWKGYSYSFPSSVKTHSTDQKYALSTAFEKLVHDTWFTKPFTRRYAEFKPLGGAITNQTFGAFPHRKAPWWMLVNHFLPKLTVPVDNTNLSSGVKLSSIEEDSNILTSASHSYTQFTNLLNSAFMKKIRPTMYAGYVDHESSLAEHESTSTGMIDHGDSTRIPPMAVTMEHYYGHRQSKRILQIKRSFDQYNIFRRALDFSATLDDSRLRSRSIDKGLFKDDIPGIQTTS